MSKLWWACFIVDTVRPRPINSGSSLRISVVLPLPLHPARPKTFIFPPQSSPIAGKPARAESQCERPTAAAIADQRAGVADLERPTVEAGRRAADEAFMWRRPVTR